MNQEQRTSTQIAIIQTKLDDIKTEITDLKSSVREINSKYVLREEVTRNLMIVEDKLTERIKRMETIVYGIIGLVLTGFMGALITMVLKK